ncbi:hypothetical protein HAX54_008804 [Datura stramonium]|uniref:Uncharacterized protein n=1 Tax=Datura stramonium TaxID=4076 RepID=A0ABS8TDX8_DATST|nr:hypothetical protein [Datura stramonium]
MFRTTSKCDSVDSNMAERFNARVLGARHKIIINMLEEIRKKVMSRFTKVAAFANTWTHDISPMEMMAANSNVEKSMKLVTNMKIWPETSNPKVEQPPVKTMPGRPSKNRKKELGKVVATSQASTSAKRKQKQKTRSSQPTQAEHLSRQLKNRICLNPLSQINQCIYLIHVNQQVNLRLLSHLN